MKGSTIKSLRKTNAWSQAHLAEAAGVSVRTIQRLERTGQCADETLLAVAAALEVDVTVLTALSGTGSEPASGKLRYLWPEVGALQAGRWGLVLLFPGTLFTLSNILKYELEFPQLYDALAAFGTWTGLAEVTSVLTSPVLLLGTLGAALVLNVMAQVNIAWERAERGVRLNEVVVDGRVLNLSIMIGALLLLGMLLGYATMENLADWIEALLAE